MTTSGTPHFSHGCPLDQPPAAGKLPATRPLAFPFPFNHPLLTYSLYHPWRPRKLPNFGTMCRFSAPTLSPPRIAVVHTSRCHGAYHPRLWHQIGFMVTRTVARHGLVLSRAGARFSKTFLFYQYTIAQLCDKLFQYVLYVV